MELDQCSDDREKFEVTDHNHVIFIGIRTHPMAKDKLGMFRRAVVCSRPDNKRASKLGATEDKNWENFGRK